MLILGTAFVPGATGAQGQAPAPASIEVVMEGKSYPSIHAYQLDRLELKMREAFYDISLQEFNDQELVSIIGKLRQEQKASQASGGENLDSVPGAVSRPASSLREESKGEVLLMEEMLKGYGEKHGKAPNLILVPEKIKTITIPSSL